MSLAQSKSGKRRLWSFNGGIHPVQNKEFSNQTPCMPASLPTVLKLPLHQHIGAPAISIVNIGDDVLKGQMIAKAKGYVSAPVHAPTSGKVIDIGNYPIPHPSGLDAPCIVIKPDGKDKWGNRPSVDHYEDIDPSSLRNIIRDAGIVGLGGAGFPSFIKLNPGPGKVVDTLILNGVECEPYITCDDRLMQERADEIIGGAKIIQHAIKARQCVIAIEDNKPQAFKTMCMTAEDEAGIDVVQVPTCYPQGSEKQLIQVITGKEVPRNGLAIHVGVVCQNVGTAAAVYRAIEHGEPLISRFVTITGSGVKRPGNMEVLIGTPINELINQCNGDISSITRLVMGGPMMGFALKNIDIPVIKTTNCILAATKDDLPPYQPEMPCIRCGSCTEVCPVSLLPQQLYWYAKNRELDKAQDHHLFDCIECGCCSFVCPSHIPLVQYYRYAKGEIWIQEREKEKSDIARLRHDFRQQRIEREKSERDAKRKMKKAAVSKNSPDNSNKAEIQAALDRTKEKKQALQNTDNESSEQT